MNFSKIFALGALALVSVLVLVNASGHYSGNYNRQALAHYGGGQCRGYGCNNHAAPALHGNGGSGHGYGPYHSYAVRPAIYGGHGLYTYQGYARHHLPAAGHPRYARSYRTGGGCHGHNCNGARYANNNNNYHHNQQLNSYAMRPINVIALQPSNGYGDHHGFEPYRHHGGYRATRGAHYEQNSYGRGHGGSHYGGAGHRQFLANEHGNNAGYLRANHHNGYQQQHASHHGFGGY